MKIAPDYRYAKAHGETRYLGAPCSKCGSRVRWSSSKNCVDCARTKTRERRQAQKAGT